MKKLKKKNKIVFISSMYGILFLIGYNIGHFMSIEHPTWLDFLL